MTDEARHDRTMTLNAHFAWSFALWASAEVSRASGSWLLAPIGFYYASFHAAYAYLNAVPGIETTTFDRMGHQQLSNLIDQHLDPNLRASFDDMRELRETINYLGLGKPDGKLRVLRGHALRFGKPSNSRNFEEMVAQARDDSRAFITRILDELAMLNGRVVDAFPRRGDVDENWLQEYMQEDIYRGLMSDGMRANAVSTVRALLA